VENVLHHDQRVQVAGKKGEEKLEKRIRKRALLIIWRLHVSQFKLAAGLFFLRLPRKLKFNLKMPRKTAGGLILLWSLRGVGSKGPRRVQRVAFWKLVLEFMVLERGRGNLFSAPFNCHKYDL